MIIKINNYELDLENIVNFYPCDILGNYQEQSIFTLVEEKDGFKGIYIFNACEFWGQIEEKAKELKEQYEQLKKRNEQLKKRLIELKALKGGAE